MVFLRAPLPVNHILMQQKVPLRLPCRILLAERLGLDTVSRPLPLEPALLQVLAFRRPGVLLVLPDDVRGRRPAVAVLMSERVVVLVLLLPSLGLGPGTSAGAGAVVLGRGGLGAGFGARVGCEGAAGLDALCGEGVLGDGSCAFVFYWGLAAEVDLTVVSV